MNQDVRTTVEEEETLAEVPEHVFNTLPDEVKLFPSAVNKARIGVWSTQRILKGRKFGPFVGEKKKRSQVKNNVYMWEVYYPNLGWMCIDATDPKKGSWLRYVNWARSAKEQNLCPLEIKRAIYYKTLKPIEPGEELLVWYNGEENPEIAAAIEEERAKHRIRRRHSPKAKKGRRKSLEGKKKANKNIGVRQRKTDSGHSSADMRDSEEGIKEDDENPSLSAVLSLEQTALIQEMVNQDALPKLMPALPSYEPQIMAREKPDSVTRERPHQSESQKENSDNEYVLEGLEKHEHLEESKSTSEETPESSPKKKVSARTPKIKTEPNGDLLDSFLFPCQHCERKFTTKQGLERHMHIHVSSFDHAFKCRYCGKAFGTQINRRRHERRHEAGPKRKPIPLASDDFSDNCAALDEPSLKTTEEKNTSSLAQDCKILESEPFGQETTHPYVKEEHVEGRGFHPCRYCKKVFGTHINMRRHQRRVHERHLLPKGVRRKGLLEEQQFQREQTQPSQSVYTTSTELDEEGETDDVYIMDVSNNISENLNYYIDGKIESNGSTSNCEVIEVQSNPAEMYKLNCLIAPVKIELSQNVMSSQTPTTDNLKESSSSVQIECKKRRTTSPPLLTSLKTEIKAEPMTTSCPLSLPLTVSVSDNLPFHKEKSVFLSSKLKQLLQTQDGSKLSPSLLTEVPKLVPTVSSAIPTVCSRFKRRTSTPPSSPQHSPGLRDFGKQMDGKPTWHEGLNTKIPKIESHSSSPAWSLSGRDERENLSPLCNDDFKMAKDWTTNLSFSSSCNQQPLDLSSGVKQRSESKCSPGPWESVLDLSIHKKTCDVEVKEQENSLMHTSCGGIKKKKPTTCMLQKVLLNEYDGKDITLEDAPCLSSSPGPCQSGQQPLSEKVSFSSSISVLSPSHILQISDSTLPLLIPTYVTSPLSFRTEFTIATRPLPSPIILPPLAEPSKTTPVSPFTSRPPSPAIISSVPEPSISIPVSSLTFPPLLPIPSLLEPSNVIPILPCSPPPPSPTVLPSLPELSNTAPVNSHSSLQSPPAVVSLLPEATNITPAPSPTPPPPIVHSSLTKPSNLILTRSCASSPPPPAKVHSSLPKHSDVSPTHSCTSPLSNKSAHSPLPVLSPTDSHSPSPVPTDDGSISSPGPPTLSSSSTSSSDSSDSSDSSSCSSSPPPLSVASFAVSPLSKITPTAFIKQEVIEEQVTPKETLRVENEESPIKDTFTKNFVCNVCESPFPSIKELKKHLSAHAEEWPFKCEFCVQLCKDTASLTEHRFSLHGVGKIFICSICKKEFAFMCNLQQHQQDVHPDKEYTHHEFESGTLRPQNFTDPSKADLSHLKSLPDPLCHEEDGELDDSSEELYTTIKIMASGEKPRDPDVRMGINQHYPSFKPPPFQYHNRNPLGIGATATNFTTHNIPQTFSTAIRCTKCGKGVDNLPELHKHILVCASASDKKRYTPKKNPVPLKHATPPKTGPPSMDSSEKNAFRRAGQPKKMLFNVENGKMSGSKLKMNALKKKNQLVHKAILQKKKSAKQKSDIKTNMSNSEPLTCPYCNRVFTYSGSLSKHAAYSCPKKPVSPVSKKNGSPPSKKYGKAMSSASKKKSSSKRRRTADAEIKMQSTETHLGKTRARSSEPPLLPSPPSPSLPPSAIKPKQNVKYVPSVKPNKQSSPPIKQSSPPIIRSASPVRMLKITQLVELKKVKTGSLNNPSTSSSKMPGKLHVRVKKNTAILKRKSSLAHERRIERSNIKLKKKPSRPITRSSQHATSTDTIENKKEDAIGKQELRDLRNLL